MLIYRLLKGDTNLTKREASQLHCGSNCKHSLNFMCHAHKKNATEVTKYGVGVGTEGAPGACVPPKFS